MISLEPGSRPNFSQILSSNSKLFPTIFSTFLHPFLSSLNQIPPSPTSSRTISGIATPGGGGGGGAEQTLLRTESDERIERVWTEWEVVGRYLDESVEEKDRKRWEGRNGKEKEKEKEEEQVEREDEIFPIRLNLPGMEGEVVTSGCMKGEFPLSPFTLE